MAHQLKTWIPSCAALEGEVGTIRRTAPRMFALGYPAPYAVAASSLGFMSIYRELNASEELVCERFFEPDPGSNADMLRTAESGLPIRAATALGFSVACETELARVAALLEAAALEPFAAFRGEESPAIVAGGPLTLLDPRLLQGFADIVVVGEAEEALPVLRDALARSGSRSEFLSSLRGAAPGLWVPALDSVPVPTAVAPASLLPAIATGYSPRAELKDLFLIEASRGCARGCAFCVLSGRCEGHRAFRPVPMERLLALIPDSAPGVGLVGAAVTDHPEIEEITARLVASGKRVSLSSMRADRLSPPLLKTLVAGGLRSLTLAADGASERVRREIHKGLSAEHLTRAAFLAAENGVRQLKVYAMVGLPGEEDADVAELSGLLSGFPSGLEVAVAVQAFVPKPSTPLASAEMAPQAVLKRRIDLLKKLSRGRFRIAATSPRWSWIDWKVAHAGPDAFSIALAAHRGGGDFAAWKEAIHRFKRSASSSTSHE